MSDETKLTKRSSDTMNALVGCPFCGKEIFEDGMTIDELEFDYHGYGPPPSYSLCCGWCGAKGPSGLGRGRDDHWGAKESAIEQWNNRSAIPKRNSEPPRRNRMNNNKDAKNTKKDDASEAEVGSMTGSECTGCIDEGVDGTHCRWCPYLDYAYYIPNDLHEGRLKNTE